MDALRKRHSQDAGPAGPHTSWNETHFATHGAGARAAKASDTKWFNTKLTQATYISQLRSDLAKHRGKSHLSHKMKHGRESKSALWQIHALVPVCPVFSSPAQTAEDIFWLTVFTPDRPSLRQKIRSPPGLSTCKGDRENHHQTWKYTALKATCEMDMVPVHFHPVDCCEIRFSHHRPRTQLANDRTSAVNRPR